MPIRFDREDLQMPHEDFSGGSGGGASPRYWLILSPSEYFHSGTVAGGAILDALTVLERQNASLLLVQHPGPGTERGWRKALGAKLANAYDAPLRASPAFLVIARRPYAEFSGEVHPFGLIDRALVHDPRPAPDLARARHHRGDRGREAGAGGDAGAAAGAASG